MAEIQPLGGDPISQSTTSQLSESMATEVPLLQPPSTPRTGSSREEYDVVQPTSQPLSLEAALIAQQMPQIRKFTGEHTGDYEGFQEWREQFELIAGTCHWSKQTKLVNLTTRLKDQAYSFYCSCMPNQRTSYSSLVEALKKRGKPCKAVCSTRGNKALRNQWDAFAQDLKQLFYKAYPHTLQGSDEAEEFGESVLASQFVACLRREIKLKLAGRTPLLRI